MNILYISNLQGFVYSGPTYSVPNQINAQNKYDNVFWYNVSETTNSIYKNYNFYRDIKDYASEDLADLPVPFNKPDLIIIEELYVYHLSKIIFKIMKSKIPYIIIPRSQMTLQAQNKKKMKKKIMNFLFYNRVINHALAIQYLTEQEKKDSNLWKTKSIVIPNGITIPEVKKEKFDKNGINAIMIGRLEPYQKGLDLLISSLILIKDELIKANFKLRIFGPVKNLKAITNLQNTINENNMSEIVQIITEPLCGENKKAELLKSDLFIMTSRFEGMPMGLLEALSYGLPCLVTQGTNMAEYVENYNAGWTAENSINSIQLSIKQILIEKDRISLKGSNALNLAQQFNWDNIAQKSNEIYSKLLM